MRQAGSATRSGSADSGGLATVRALATADGGPAGRCACAAAGAQHPGTGQHSWPLTTLTVTVAVASRAEIPNIPRYTGRIAAVTW
jgi:hypothetical protein